MKYRDLLQFSPVQSRVDLIEADDGEAARRLLASYVLSKVTASLLAKSVVPLLHLNDYAEARALFLFGASGSGKSHFLAALSSLANCSGVADEGGNANEFARESERPADLGTALAAIAGRYQVIRLNLGSTATALREVVLSRIGQFLALPDGAETVPAPPESVVLAPTIDTLMALFDQRFPEQGLLVVADDLLDGLLGKSGDELTQDLDFLQELGVACRRLKIRFVASGRESILAQPRLAVTAAVLARLQPHWAEIEINASPTRLVVQARLVPKTPAQREMVEKHLSKFVPCYGGMRKRLEEFTNLFPLHPDSLSVVESLGSDGLGGTLSLLSAAVAQRLDDELPDDEPGIIADDSFWAAARAMPSKHDSKEQGAVLDFSRLLEERLERLDPPAEDPAMARRLIHALSMRRLGACDVYGGHGVTAEELRDALCLYQKNLDGTECDRSAVLLSRVKRCLYDISRCGEGPVLSVRCQDGRYDFHFRKFRRFRKHELILHWVNAVPFLLLMVSGGVMLGSRFSHLDREFFSWAVTMHKVCALTWLAGLPLSVSSRFRFHWENVRTFLSWGAKDAVWMVQSLRSLYSKSATIPAAGRFNTGQKINACLVILYYFGFASTGLLMFWKGTILVPWYIHTALFFSAMGSTGGHLFLALINPSTRIALGGIFHGWAPMKYIRHHHELSLPASLQTHAGEPCDRAIAAGAFVSKVEICVLAGTFLLAGAGAYAFGKGRVATVKKQFAQSFADAIQPSQLNTKHRLGPTAESCIKCHLFTGEIPNRKCEDCHQDVRARREQKLGFHGTFKGDCRLCHREHREHTALVPLDRTKFNHDKTLFKLEGKHTEVQCDDCHAQARKPNTAGIYYLGLKHERCADCHRDQHAGQFSTACESCHTPAGWTGTNLKFKHETGSKFSLAGQHASIDCKKCHQPPTPESPLGAAKFKGLAMDCAGCHADPHRQQFATRCADCHTPAGWGLKHLNFDHAKDAKFSLIAKHAQVACAKCHLPLKAGDALARAQFRGLKTECADCHQDPHRGQFARDCTKCHATPDTWKVDRPRFLHNRDTKFALQGKHAAVQCSQCHQPKAKGASLASAQFRGLETACASCHKVEHPASYGSTCTACHTPAAWIAKEPPFDHTRDAGFELVGRHFVANCSACHTATVMSPAAQISPAAYTCAACHEKNDPHKGSLGTSCSKCHGPIGWKGEDLLFEHNRMARFALDRDHVNVACVKCHVNNKWKPLDTACASCHTRFFLDGKK